jgi:hypothetical protein
VGLLLSWRLSQARPSLVRQTLGHRQRDQPRTIRNHARGCSKCASGEGHPLWVRTVSYAASANDRLVYAASKYLRCVVGCMILGETLTATRRSANVKEPHAKQQETITTAITLPNAALSVSS